MRYWRFGRVLMFAALAVLLGVVLWRTTGGTRTRSTIPYSTLVTQYIGSDAQSTRVQQIRVIGSRLDVLLKTTDEHGRPERKLVYLGPMSVMPDLVRSWTDRGITVEFRPASSAWRLVLGVFPYVIILVAIFLIFRQTQSGQQGIFSFGKSRARELTEDVPTITFAEVAGVEEAKQELQEVVEFLREPEKFQRLGGKIPRGVLMVGPPGTGKTYLARAIAGEAGVPFFYISGSDFVEMFVGVGASRVRDLFDQAKRKSPCIVFIDEIDAVGRHRGAGLGGGHDEREQTLNQLLVEMDGFSSSRATVILIAATNRPDVLDPALLRPGRFDRQVYIDMPDARGREGILKIHTRQVPLAPDVDLHAVARGTSGLSGADLRNLVNEAALLAARSNRSEVSMSEFERAKEKVMWGTERRSLVMTDQERHVTAVHEAGHALVALFTPEADPVHKCSIVPRGRSLGLTSFLPVDERHTVTRGWCMAKLVGILGGRAAEMLVFNEITNGAANDLDTATELARRMVCDWGMSERVGPATVGHRDEEVFIGKELFHSHKLSERTLEVVDAEVRRFVDDALRGARALLEQHRDALDGLSKALLVHEVLDRPQIEDIVRTVTNQSQITAQFGRPEEEPPRPKVVERGAQTPPVEERPPQPSRQERPRRERPPREQAVTIAPPPLKAEGPPTHIEEEETEVVAAQRHVPEPSHEEKAEPAPAAAPERVSFGRKPKVVRRTALPTSRAPEAGMPVSAVLSEHIVYGRPLRPADEAGGSKAEDTAMSAAEGLAAVTLEVTAPSTEEPAAVMPEPTTPAAESISPEPAKATPASETTETSQEEAEQKKTATPDAGTTVEPTPASDVAKATRPAEGEQAPPREERED